MASLCKRERSQFWHINYRDPATRKRRRDPTPYRINNKLETRNARELEAKKTYEEKQAPRALAREQWQAWVRPFLERRYYEPERKTTLTKYLGCWRTIEAWLIENGTLTPAQVDHGVVMGYIDWRRKSRAKKPIAPGTVVIDIKVFRLVMDEAARRRFTTTVNPCLRLGLSRKPLREGRAIRDDEDETIVAALTDKAEWMQVSYEIGITHGCRFKETRLPLNDVDLACNKIKFHAKGGKVYEVELVATLVPLMRRLKKRGAQYTWDLPTDEMKQCGRNWTRFLRKLGFDDLWFHCTRYTAIKRAHRADVSLASALAFFGHSGKTLVHFVYAELGTEDTTQVAQAMAAHQRPSLFGERSRNRSKQNRDSFPAKPKRAGKSSRLSRIGSGSRTPSSPSRIVDRGRAGRPMLCR